VTLLATPRQSELWETPAEFFENVDREFGFTLDVCALPETAKCAKFYNSDGTVDKIKFPNGGWEDDFVSQKVNGDGTVTVTDEDGREFTVPSR
jgi:hypothetical protein